MRSSLVLLAWLVAACQEVTTDNFMNPAYGPPSTCGVIENLPGCDQGSISYNCSDDRPDGTDADTQRDPNLVCSNGTPGANGSALYCCIPISQYDTDCVPDPNIAGCIGAAVGFSCAGQDTLPTGPSDADPTIACSAAQANGGANEYCCNTAEPIQTCAVDPTVACAGVGVGYSCGSTDPPLDPSSGFVCTPAGTRGGDTNYCCVPQ